MSSTTPDTAAPVPTHRVAHAATASVLVLFGLFYAYDIWEAVGNLLGINQAAGGLDTRVSAFGWSVLILGVLMPVIVYGIALWLGRKRSSGVLALLLLVGLGIVAVLSLDFFVLFPFARLIV